MASTGRLCDPTCCPLPEKLGCSGSMSAASDRLSRQRVPYAAASIGVAVKAQEFAIDYAK
jgi:hypothetical protein